MPYSRYIVECNNDKILVRGLLNIKLGQIHHAGSKTEVLKRLTKYSDSLGLVDEDPDSPPPPLMRSITLEDIGHGIKLGKLRGNMLVVLCPRLEEWVVEAAKEADIGLQRSPKELHLDTKRFRDVIQGLIGSDSKRISKLKSLFHEGGSDDPHPTRKRMA